jgi:hypothetical protein
MNFDDYKNTLPSKVPEDARVRVQLSEARKALAAASEALLNEGKRTYAAYCEESVRLHDKFKADALEELGLTGHPKAEKLFEKAWEKGHSDGLYSVYEWMETLKELIED